MPCCGAELTLQVSRAEDVLGTNMSTPLGDLLLTDVDSSALTFKDPRAELAATLEGVNFCPNCGVPRK